MARRLDPVAMADFALSDRRREPGSVMFQRSPGAGRPRGAHPPAAATLPRAPGRKTGSSRPLRPSCAGMPPAPASQLAGSASPGQTAQRSGRTTCRSSRRRRSSRPSITRAAFLDRVPANQRAGSGYGASVFLPGGAVTLATNPRWLRRRREPLRLVQPEGRVACRCATTGPDDPALGTYLKVVSARRERTDRRRARDVRRRRPFTDHEHHRAGHRRDARAARRSRRVRPLDLARARPASAAPAFTRMVRSLEIHDVASHP